MSPRRSILAIGVVALGIAGGIGAWWSTSGDTQDAVAEATESTDERQVNPPSTTAPSTTTSTTTLPPTTLPPLMAHPLPHGSGEGRRVVFSISAQRMWWVGPDGLPVRTASVSGRAETPAVGSYQVFSRSEQATGLDGSRMQLFVRFTRGENGWAIGFHDIPTMGGVPVQTIEQLGTPLSHGCIRQAPEDALFTWSFLQLGDTVVVIA